MSVLLPVLGAIALFFLVVIAADVRVTNALICLFRNLKRTAAEK